MEGKRKKRGASKQQCMLYTVSVLRLCGTCTLLNAILAHGTKGINRLCAVFLLCIAEIRSANGLHDTCFIEPFLSVCTHCFKRQLNHSFSKFLLQLLDKEKCDCSPHFICFPKQMLKIDSQTVKLFTNKVCFSHA